MLALTLTAPKKALELLPVDEPSPPEDGEILVRMDYGSVQPLDSELAAGGLGVECPQAMGTEGVGTVLESRCPEFAAGARVGFRFWRVPGDFGCWRPVVKLSAARALIAEIPRDVAPQEAAGGLASSLLAAACLRHFQPGAVLVVPGACGAVGLALLQLAAIRGMKVVGLVRGSFRTAWIAKELGPVGEVYAVDVSVAGWQEILREVCGARTEGDEGADGVLDGVGGELLLQVLEATALKARGMVATFGHCAGAPEEARLAAAVRRRSLQVQAEGLPEALARPDARAQLLEALTLMSAGKYRPRVWQNVNWQDAGHVLVPQPSWSKYISQFTEGRIGRIVLKFG